MLQRMDVVHYAVSTLVYEAYVSKIVYYTWTFGAQFHCLIDGVTYYI